LGSYDALAAAGASKQDIEEVRVKAESLVTVGPHTLQFDSLSRDRMRLVIKGAEDGETISWRMANNTEVSFTPEELESLYEAAEIEAGRRLLQVHEKARQFKNRLAAGERVTMRDIHITNW